MYEERERGLDNQQAIVAVFLLARMREEYDRTGSTRDAIVGSLSRTGRPVTSAATILAVSFLSLSTNPDRREGLPLTARVAAG